MVDTGGLTTAPDEGGAWVGGRGLVEVWVPGAVPLPDGWPPDVVPPDVVPPDVVPPDVVPLDVVPPDVPPDVVPDVLVDPLPEGAPPDVVATGPPEKVVSNPARPIWNERDSN